MKVKKTLSFIVLFFLFIAINLYNCIAINIFFTNKQTAFGINNKINLYCKNIINNSKKYTFYYNNNELVFYSNDYINNSELSFNQNKILCDKKAFDNTLKFMEKLNLSKREIINYLCPEVKNIKEELCKIIDINPEENYVEYVKNSCKLNYVYGKKGVYLDQNDFYNKIYASILNNNKNVVINIKIKSYENSYDIKNNFQEKSCFSTNFASSSNSRKNNIRVALEAFDGIMLDEGDILSFNAITGVRNEKSGYKKAKIISNGTFVEGYGGGVCQVSTTLYNACLLAGLEIIEVHNHSLPVSYIEPSFDAMVNSGSSDLVIRNNSNGKIIITTSYVDDICKIKIFGKKNKYKITRLSEKIKIIPAKSDYIEYDTKKYNENSMQIGEEKRLSYPKDGYVSNGYLCYYDKDNNLVNKEMIRTNIYNATKGIILKKINEN